MELRGDLSPKNGESGVNALIIAKCGEKELELDVDAEIWERGWPSQVRLVTKTIIKNYTHK